MLLAITAGKVRGSNPTPTPAGVQVYAGSSHDASIFFQGHAAWWIVSSFEVGFPEVVIAALEVTPPLLPLLGLLQLVVIGRFVFLYLSELVLTATNN